MVDFSPIDTLRFHVEISVDYLLIFGGDHRRFQPNMQPIIPIMSLCLFFFTFLKILLMWPHMRNMRFHHLIYLMTATMDVHQVPILSTNSIESYCTVPMRMKRTVLAAVEYPSGPVFWTWLNPQVAMVSEQFQSSFRAVSEQFQSSFLMIFLWKILQSKIQIQH